MTREDENLRSLILSRADPPAKSCGDNLARKKAAVPTSLPISAERIANFASSSRRARRYGEYAKSSCKPGKSAKGTEQDFPSPFYGVRKFVSIKFF